MTSTSTFQAMGTTIVVHGAPDDASEARKLFAANERRFSRFLEDSELSRLNADLDDTVEVSPEMARILGAASEMRTRTDGLVDIGIGEAVVAWGYDRTFPEVADRSDEPDALPRTTWSIQGSVVRRPHGVRLDLGGIAKGWTCDDAVTGGLATVASAGGDLRSSDVTLVADIEHDGEVVAELEVGVGALATSSTRRRRWRVAGNAAHHIIDPRTMAPSVSPIVSASAVTGTAVEAEAAAKAILLLGVDGLAWADRQRWIRRALVVWRDGMVYATKERSAA